VTPALIALLAAALQSAQPTAAPLDASPPQRLSAAAFGGRAAVEVHGLDPGAARSAAIAALDTIRELDALTDPSGSAPGGIGDLNRAAPRSVVKLQPRVIQLLARALTFCDWSSGAHGPLGGRLYELWGLRSPAPGLPPADRLEAARTAAGCANLRLDAASSSASLEVGSRVDAWGFAAGFAVDEAVAVLRASGARNGWAEAGAAQRGFGAGPSGSGWPVTLPATPGSKEPGPTVLLVDRSLAVADAGAPRLRVGGEERAPFIDQRSGRPPDGILFTAASTELAVDAQALAVAAFVMGSREGQFRAGNLRPRPALYWAAGGGNAEPMVISYGWSALPRP